MTPFETLHEVGRRTVEAIIAQSRLSHDGLRQALRNLLASNDPHAGGLLQQPILEGAHPFETADETMSDLSGRLLHADLIAALDGLSEDHDYRFPRTRKPFRHQVETWRRLAETEPQSVLVTSGTGSGKTECFLFPILSSLAGQAESRREPLEGVQAIMLYPLNALIESQRERLSAWTKPFDGKLRFCLYNGDLPNAAKESDRRRTPEQVIDRERLRASPPSLLVTNVTMLEYMLVRAEDRPIIDASKGKLKWIVLDEAHSLVGAAAAEIALLLRRVLLAFDVKPEEVRFIATSATIGSGEKVRQQLQRFLADVAGIPDGRVHVIEGHRQRPRRPEPGPERQKTDILHAEPDELYTEFAGNPETWDLVERLFKGSVPLAAFEGPASKYGITGSELAIAMSRAARKAEDGEEERLVPIRLHAFQRAVPGFWSCINPTCGERPADWPFGRLLAERADVCPTCQAPVLEILSCAECGEPYLEGIESASRLTARLRNPPRDEFAFDSARESESESEETQGDEERASQPDEVTFVHERLFAANPTPSARDLCVDPKRDWRVLDQPCDGSVKLRAEEHFGSNACPHCHPVPRDGPDLLRPLRFGAPFILGNAAPVLLEGVSPAEANPGVQLPSSGKRLLSFTDSRQGTARIAAKLQIESERNFVRSFIYHQAQFSMRPSVGASNEENKLKEEIHSLEEVLANTWNAALENMLTDKRAELARLTSGNNDGIAWPDLVDRLANRIEVAEWIREVWQARDEELFSDPSRMAEFLLLREFLRRPKRANSVETLGIARLRYPVLDGLVSSHIPEAFRRKGKTLEDWRAYLSAVLTWFVRANGAVATSARMQHWVLPKGRLTSFVGPDRQTDGNPALRAWPNGQFRAHLRSRPVALLLQGLGLTLDEKADRADLDECLRAAWNQLQPAFSDDPDRRALDFRKTFVAPLTEAYYCPVSRRILDCAPFGLTPYGLWEKIPARQRAIPITLPRHPEPILGDVNPAAARPKIREWTETDATIQELRAKGQWTNISDRIALFVDFARTAEHSAQQDSARLRRYERAFKAGSINILNCSTTMEMGVDIGSVSSVMMTNVPPSIANYRQRVGRAGRRGQSISMAFTFCKDRPLDRDAFHDPQSFLQRSVAAPKVTLSSRPIVQRHVNAFMLANFLREHSGDGLRMEIGAFLGCPADPRQNRPPKSERPVEAFIDWLERPSTAQSCRNDLAALTRRSILEGDQRLVEDTKAAILALSEVFVAEWDGLVVLAKDEGFQQAGRSRMAIELARMCGEFLLGALADRGFLPGHGFPTNVVSFFAGPEFKSQQDRAQDGRRQFRAVGPQRSLDLAIREYAPGSEVVLDGLVYKSAGVTLNWKRPVSEENLAEIQSLRHISFCENCGARDTHRGRSLNYCSVCGSNQIYYEEFLRPAGFSVDPRERAHAETDILSFIPPEDPAVSTRGSVWRSLPAPQIGRFRCSREGLVYYSNRGGPQGHGYAICLHCGRAEADGDNNTLSSPAPALVDHKPLRFRKGSELCPGNEKPYSIKRNITLGLEVTTDVVEIQPHHPLKRAGANALAIAFREALAQELGIESDEMGYSVSRSENSLGAPAVSLFLFDRATGGAGFVVSFEHMLGAVFRRAEEILDCKAPGCEKACAACVLTSDAPDDHDELDRRVALDFLRTSFALPVDLAPEDRFVEGAQLSLSPLDEMSSALRHTPHSTAILFVSNEADPAVLDDWPVATELREWKLRGYRPQVVFPSDYLSKCNSADKHRLRDFALRHDVDLATGNTVVFPNGAFALAMVLRKDQTGLVWASRELELLKPGLGWGQPINHSVAYGRASLKTQLIPVDLDELRSPPGAQLIEISNELDVDLSSFGHHASTLIREGLRECGGWSSAAIVSVNYQDPYVTSPLVARLLIDTIAELCSSSDYRGTTVTIETRPPRSDDTRTSPWQIGHDWRKPEVQKQVVELLGKKRGLAVSFYQKDVPHGRYLMVQFADGCSAAILLDQGFGAWAPPRNIPVKFDFSETPQNQAERLAAMNVVLQRRGIGKTYIVAASRTSPEQESAKLQYG